MGTDNKFGEVSEGFPRYLENENLNKIVKDLVHKAEKEIIPSRIFYTLADGSENFPPLSTIPHRSFIDDLQIIYHIKTAEADDKKFGSYIVRSEDAEYLNLKEEDLFKIASQNTNKLFRPITRTIQDVWVRDYMEQGYSLWEATEKAYKKFENSPSAYICCSYGSPYGTSLLLDKNFLCTMAGKLGGDYYVLFNSTDSFAAIRKEDYTNTFFVEIDSSLAANAPDDKIRLSDKMYLYSQKEGRLLTHIFPQES